MVQAGILVQEWAVLHYCNFSITTPEIRSCLFISACLSSYSFSYEVSCTITYSSACTVIIMINNNARAGASVLKAAHRSDQLYQHVQTQPRKSSGVLQLTTFAVGTNPSEGKSSKETDDYCTTAVVQHRTHEAARAAEIRRDYSFTLTVWCRNCALH